jgi:hypothetical protein
MPSTPLRLTATGAEGGETFASSPNIALAVSGEGPPLRLHFAEDGIRRRDSGGKFIAPRVKHGAEIWTFDRRKESKNFRIAVSKYTT